MCFCQLDTPHTCLCQNGVLYHKNQMKKKNRGHKGDAQKVNLTTKQLRLGVPKEVEIITPEAKPVLAQRQIPGYVRGTTIAVSAGFLFWVVAWCLQSFLSIRGVVDINASRVILIVMWFSGALLICLLARVLPFIRRKQLVAILCNVLWIMSVVALDRWAARPQVTNIPTPAPYVRPADWRTIKDWQKAELVPLLERYPNYTLHIMASAVSDESLDYANQFKELFAAHKWKVIGPETVADQIALNMQLSISDQYWGKPGPEAFTALNSALQFIHIKTTPNFVVDPVARPDNWLCGSARKRLPVILNTFPCNLAQCAETLFSSLMTPCTLLELAEMQKILLDG